MNEPAFAKPKKISFTKYFENTVNSFLDPSLVDQKEKYERQLDEWRSDLSYVPNLLECIQKTKLPNSLFFSSLCIKFLLLKFNEEISTSDIQDIFEGIARRLHNIYGIFDKNKEEDEEEEEEEQKDVDENIITEFHKCRINLLQCISLIQVYFPDFIEKWIIFLPEDSKILLGFLFEEESKQLPDPRNIFMKKISIISMDNIKKVLKNTEMSPEWLILFKYALQKAHEIGDYSEFFERLYCIPEYSNLYPKFIEVFEECIENEYFFLSERSIDFMERVFDIGFEIIEQLLSQPSVENVQMASDLWGIILGYDKEFLSERYTSLRNNEKNKKIEKSKVLDFFIESLKIIIQFDEEFFVLLEKVSEMIGLLIELDSIYITPAIIRILSFLVDVINLDPVKYMKIELSLPFFNVSKFNGINLLNRFYSEIIQPQEHEGIMMISPGAIFAIASSSEYYRNEYSLKMADVILSNPGVLPPNIVLYFTSECCNFCGQRVHQMIEFSFNSIGTGTDIDATNSIVKLCKYYPQIIIDTPEYLETISDFILNTRIDDVYSIVNIVQALLYIMNYTKSGHQAYQKSEESIKVGILEKAATFYESDESCRFVLQLINCYAEMVNKIMADIKNNPELCEYLASLCSQIIDKVNFTNVFYGFDEMENEGTGAEEDGENKSLKISTLIQEQLCSFVSISLDTGMIQNKDYIIDWIGISLSKTPITDHFGILEKVSDLFPTDLTLDFILNVGNSGDNELMIASLKFVRYLAKQSWKPFFATFPQTYFLGPLESPDTRILDITLEIVSAIIDMEIQSTTIFFENDHYDIATKITDGVFTNFEELEITKSINIWIKLIEAEFIVVENLLGFVLSKIPEKCAEYHSFCQALTPGEFGFDRMQILRTVNGLKASLAMTD